MDKCQVLEIPDDSDVPRRNDFPSRLPGAKKYKLIKIITGSSKISETMSCVCCSSKREFNLLNVPVL